MTENASHEDMESFENPNAVPLEELKLKVKTAGVVETVSALNKRWISDRYFLHYEVPRLYDNNGIEIVGAKEHWIEVVNYMIDDLRWLLSLPFYKFWSNIIYNTSIMDSLVSFLQEAPPFYALENFPNFPEMLDLLETLRHYVLLVFMRLITNKESTTEYMSCQFLGNLLYENYIFTVPIIFDLCQLYGRENSKIIEKILKCIFTIEERYNTDLHTTVPCLIKALENVEKKFNNSKPYVDETTSLSKQSEGSKELSLFNVEDMVLYVLDISSTVSVFLKNYPPAVSIFHQEDFMTKIVSIYESTMPEMYKKLDKLGYNDENLPKYMEIKHRLDVMRVEFLNLYRTILNQPILEIEENLDTVTEAEIKERVDEYLNYLSNAVSEKEFITDYHQFYPVDRDLEMLLNKCPEIDTIKCDYILQVINTTIGKGDVPSVSFSNNIAEAVAGPSGIQNHQSATNSTEEKAAVMNSPEELESLKSEVKEILYHLEDYFIELCLQHYNYNTTAVINAVLENTLPSHLNELQDVGATNATQLDQPPPPDYAIDEFFMEPDEPHNPSEITEVSKDYIIKNYGLVADDYEDEYDDTYDSHDIRSSMRDDPKEIDSRPFITPRVLLGKEKNEASSETESKEESTEAEHKDKDHFVQPPRHPMQSGRARPNVVGKPAGQGQEKETSYNRQQKKTHKATRANHNRRSGAQWKRSQGMVPS